ncbi:DUF5610 domain-containing protein [Amphritea sp. 1_MG-2023]|uniref:DUF5610 domain-containing protein n=1 Tax=Amphritea sp. 1_MG-2023 TaxID=3062670 RepID=UPI0026E1A411|nr:DUF5610 domain-containing protein [Amphritea sp. 1_MG-2023]MDO6564160.1 DUF5610 domain-containing protein [Amphritea sp. 1_MG-2023]
MEITSISPQAATEQSKTTGTDTFSGTTAATQAQENKTAHNQAILQAALEVSISSGNDSLTLLYRSAVTELNKVLETDLGESSIQKAYDSGLDVSPDATAERIVSLSAGFFSSYQAQHPEMNYQDQVTHFVDVIGGGIDQGFSEARDILDGLQVLDGDIASNIDKTYDLVQEKLSILTDSLLEQAPSLADEAGGQA